MSAPEALLPSPLPSARLAEMVNHTRHPAQYFQHVDPQGGIFHVVAARLTFDLQDIDPATREPRIAQRQVSLAATDARPGEPGEPADFQDSDFAPFKPRCDVLFRNVRAHSPDGRKHERFAVGVKLGEWQKIVQVAGPRVQRRGLLGWKVGSPQPVDTMMLGYESAFGGTRSHDDRTGQRRLWADHRNPVGLGYAPDDWDRLARPSELPAPRIEVNQRPYQGEADYPVVGFGAIARAWLPRRRLAGTFDASWKENAWPALPRDHDYRYWNCAPEDQQLAYPAGGELVRLVGLGAPGLVELLLPRRRPALRVRLAAGPILTLPMNLDTLDFDLAAGALGCVFRLAVAAGADVRKLELGTWEARHGH